MKKICIVHYNTPYALTCLIKSINLHVNDAYIYVFENSDKELFVNTFDNVEIFDNSHGQILDYETILQNYPDRFKTESKNNGWASFKHCLAIDKCMDLIDDNFVLLDSDVLIKKDFSDLYQEDKIAVGEYESYYERLAPYICFINVNLCKKHNIRYFNEDYILGIKFYKDKQKYDTGSYFYKEIKKYDYETIKIKDYIVHYQSGSFSSNLISKKTTLNEWVNNFKQYWVKEINIQNKTVIYTCITGNYETLVDPSVISEDFDYVCFTDNLKLKSNIWEIREIPEELKHLSNVKQQRCIKICPHKYLNEYNDSIWLDANIDIIEDIKTFINTQCDEKDKTIFIPQHPSRQCIYKEGAECIKIKKDKSDIINFQLDKYLTEGFPENYGLVQTGIMYRKHNELSCVEVMELWESELSKHSHRDQLSFNYSLWKLNSNALQYLDKKLFNSKYFKIYRHNRGINNRIKQDYLLDEYNITNIKTKKEHKKTIEAIVNTRQQINRLKKKSDDRIINAMYDNR